MGPVVAFLSLFLGVSGLDQSGGYVAGAELPLFDCHLGYYNWKKMWTPEWKSWCCEHEGRGCPTTITATITETSETTVTETTVTQTTRTVTLPTTATTTSTTTMTMTTTNLGCGTNCTFGPYTATCGDRMHWGMRDVHILDSAAGLAGSAFHEHVCLAAGDLVSSQCPSCRVCSVKKWCEEERHLGCSANCTFSGHSATCDARMRWSMTNDATALQSENACAAAGDLVMAQCPNCGICSVNWWCAKNAAQPQGFVFQQKFQTIDDGQLAHTDLSKLTSSSLIMACIVTVAVLTLMARRSEAARMSAAVTAVGQEVESTTPLCPTSADPASSGSV